MVFIRKTISRGCAYAQLVHTERVNGKVRTKVIRHIGPWSSLSERLAEPRVNEIDYFSSYNYADINVLFKLSEELNLRKILNNNTAKGGGVNVGELSLIIILNHCLDPTSKCQINKWFSRTYLPQLMKLSPDKANKNSLTRVLDYLTEEKIIQIEKAIVKQLEKIFNLKKDYLMYDITSTYVYGNNCEIAKYGYNRDYVPEKQINFGLILSKIGNFPLMHRIFKGNVVDVTTICSTADRIKKQLNVNTCMLVLDRGMMSEDNLVYLDELEFGYIVGLTKTTSLVKQLFLESKKSEVIKEKKLYACETIKTYYDKNKKEKKRKYVVFLDEEKQKEDKEKRDKELEKIKTKLLKLQKQIGKRKYKERDEIVMKIGEIIKGSKRFFNIKHDKDKLEFEFSLNKSIIEREEKFDGKHVVCCTDINMSAREILLAYKDKDKAEKAFRCIKSFIRVQPIRHWITERVKSHIFLCVLAYLLQKILEYKLEQNNLKISAQEALSELAGIKMISYKIGTKVVDKITKIDDKQELILEKLGYWPFK